MEDQKNFITFVVLATIIVMIYMTFFGQQAADRVQDETTAAQQLAEIEAQNQTVELKPREDVVQTGQRIAIETPSLSGSFLVQGSRFDDITLKKYRQTIAEDSPGVVLLTPEGVENAAYISDNWAIVDRGTGAESNWQLISGDRLTPENSVIMRLENDGYTVDRTVSIDDRYLITLNDRITNTSGSDITLNRFGFARQHGIPKGDGDARDVSFILHQGATAIIDGKQTNHSYKKFDKKPRLTLYGPGGWVGLTDKYWLSAAIAPQGDNITADFSYRKLNDAKIFESSYKTEPVTLTPGVSVDSVGYIFAGAKDRSTLVKYEKEIGIAQMERAIDWGRLRLLTRPMNWLISKFYGLLGNYGLAIIALTTLIKLVLFPIFNRQYASQAKMKKVAPKQKKLQELYKDDRVRLQQEVMALYKKEGVNPLAGCLPIIPTIFVFFALYKTCLLYTSPSPRDA